MAARATTIEKKVVPLIMEGNPVYRQYRQITLKYPLQLVVEVVQFRISYRQVMSEENCRCVPINRVKECPRQIVRHEIARPGLIRRPKVNDRKTLISRELQGEPNTLFPT